MEIYLLGALCVILAGAVAGGIAYLLRRRFEREGRTENNESAGQVFTIVGGLHAVLVAFVLIGLFDAVGTTRDNANHEADSLVAMTWASDSLPEPQRTEIHDLAANYANQVINQEWPKLRAGTPVDDTAWSTLERLKTVISSAPVSAGWQTDRKTEAANQLWTVYQDRQTRVDEDSQGIGAVIWLALAIGSILSVALPMLFGGPKEHAHLMIIAALAGTLALLIYAIYQLQNPFAGGASVGPEAFRSALERLG
ncbi:MAG TPA: hypothetical protein VHF06_11490 [Pseudonocardiaceae bacterium]|jgi:hypothetical protein|nr:hypothetical protein [Pseudonocardiaceae bacterium]